MHKSEPLKELVLLFFDRRVSFVVTRLVHFLVAHSALFDLEILLLHLAHFVGWFVWNAMQLYHRLEVIESLIPKVLISARLTQLFYFILAHVDAFRKRSDVTSKKCLEIDSLKERVILDLLDSASYVAIAPSQVVAAQILHQMLGTLVKVLREHDLLRQHFFVDFLW